MNGMVWRQGKLKFATKLLPNCFWSVRYVVEIFGGPDRDRTDDLFHAMEARSQLRHRPTLFIVNCCTRLRQLKLVGFALARAGGHAAREQAHGVRCLSQ